MLVAKALVVGSGVSGLQASLDLASFGHKVLLVEQEEEIGGNLRHLNNLYPNDQEASALLADLTTGIKNTENVKILTKSTIMDIAGEFPHFKLQVETADEEVEAELNAIVLATGFRPFDPSSLKQFGYGKYKEVITSLELEGMMAHGDLIKLSRTGKLEALSLIQCIGSRNVNTNTYCSSYCCMNTIKLASEIKQIIPTIEVTVLYMDLRTPYDGELSYRNARRLGVRFLRGNPARLKKIGERLVIQVEDTLENDLVSVEADLVVLATGAVPDVSNTFFKEKLGISTSASGFIEVVDTPVKTNIKGVFAAGAATGPKDIAYSMAQGSCAAAEVDIALKSIETQ